MTSRRCLGKPPLPGCTGRKEGEFLWMEDDRSCLHIARRNRGVIGERRTRPQPSTPINPVRDYHQTAPWEA